MNAISSNVEQWSAVVNQFINSHAKSLQPDEKDDLRQDIFVALIEGYGPDFERCTELWADLIACRVLEDFREERRIRTTPRSFDDVPDATAPDLDFGMDLTKSLERLPNGLRKVAVDLFYHNLTQQEVADKYKRNQTWVAAAKKQIVSQIYSFLQEKTPCR
jgi:DNA-directed RNA polymerase specialized sigma24 family protein